MANQIRRDARIFLSYARADLDVANQLKDRLSAAGFEVAMDVADIAPGEAWRERILSLLQASEKVVFMISRAALASKICAWELNEADARGKPIIPLLIEDVPDEAILPGLSRLQRIDLTRPDAWEAGLRDLEAALRRDLPWERERTRINDLAEAWDAVGRPARRLSTRVERIREMEAWRDGRPISAEPPTALQLQFIAESRRARTRRERRRLTDSFAGGAAAVLLAIAALFQSTVADQNAAEAERQRDEAEIQRAEAAAQRDEAEIQRAAAAVERDRALRSQSSQSLALAQTASEEAFGGQPAPVNAANGVLVALEALPDRTPGPDGALLSDRPYETSAEQALRIAMTGYGPQTLLHIPGDRIYGAGFLDGDDSVFGITYDAGLFVWTRGADGTWGAPAAVDTGEARITAHHTTVGGRLLIGDADGFVRQIVRSGDAWRATEPLPVFGRTTPVASITAGGGAIAALSRNGLLSIWFPSSADHGGPRDRDFRPSQISESGGAVALAPDGRALIVLSNQDVRFFLGELGPDKNFIQSRGYIDSNDVRLVEPQLSFSLNGDSLFIANLGMRHYAGLKTAEGPIQQQHPLTIGNAAALRWDGDNDRLFIGSRDGGVAAYRLDENKALFLDGGDPRLSHFFGTSGTEFNQFSAIDKSPSGALLTSFDGAIWLWSQNMVSETRETVASYGFYADYALALEARSGAAIRTDDGEIVVIEANGSIVARTRPASDTVGAMAYAPGLDTLFFASDGHIYTWPLARAETAPPSRLPGVAAERITGVAVSRYGARLALTVDDDDETHLDFYDTSNLAAPQGVTRLTWPPGGVSTVAFAENGQRAFIGKRDGGWLRVAEIDGQYTEGEESISRPHSFGTDAFHFLGSDERFLSVGSGGVVVEWRETPDGTEPVGRSDAIANGVTSVTTSPSADMIATTARGGFISFLRLAEDQPAGQIDLRTASGANRESGAPILGALTGFWAADDDFRVLVDDPRSKSDVRLVSIRPPEPVQALVDRAKRAAARCLTVREREALGLERAPPRWCVTGPGREAETDPALWRPLWPYDQPAWRDWLAARDAGTAAAMPSR